MKASTLLSALFVFCFLASVAFGRHSHEFLVDEINADPTAGWKADPNLELFSRFHDDSQIQRLMGVVRNRDPLPELSPAERGISPNMEIPDSFDSRTAWKGCVGAIRDQGRCGSCWAFGGIEALSDRFCVASNGTVNVTLAPLDPITCDENDMGCQGGDPSTLWEYTKTSGVVEESCAPYNDSIPTCPPAKEPCLNFVNTPACKKSCRDGSSWSSSKHYTRSTYSISSSVTDIQHEIMTNGPVEAAFTVYEDFLAYKSGVYKHVKGGAVGGHAVKMIGWGVDSSSGNTPYWIIANSWTTTWGNDGYFWILRGKDECGIEDNVVAGLPKIQ